MSRPSPSSPGWIVDGKRYLLCLPSPPSFRRFDRRHRNRLSRPPTRCYRGSDGSSRDSTANNSSPSLGDCRSVPVRETRKGYFRIFWFDNCIEFDFNFLCGLQPIISLDFLIIFPLSILFLLLFLGTEVRLVFSHEK